MEEEEMKRWQLALSLILVVVISNIFSYQYGYSCGAGKAYRLVKQELQNILESNP